MRLYLFTQDDGVQSWHGTRAEAQDSGKRVTPIYRAGCTVQECDLPVSKENILKLIRGEAQFEILRTWRMTSRGGLKLEQ